MLIYFYKYVIGKNFKSVYGTGKRTSIFIKNHTRNFCLDGYWGPLRRLLIPIVGWNVERWKYPNKIQTLKKSQPLKFYLPSHMLIDWHVNNLTHTVLGRYVEPTRDLDNIIFTVEISCTCITWSNGFILFPTYPYLCMLFLAIKRHKTF